MHVLFATPEVAPYTKTGGLADVARSLPPELKRLNVDISIITLLHGGLDAEELRLAERLLELKIEVDGETLGVKVYEGTTPDNIRIFFLSNEELFDRDPIYGPKKGEEYDDNGVRFGAFAKAVCEFVTQSATLIDVVHCNEWQTALVPVLMKEIEDYAENDKISQTVSLLTLHNLAYQGQFDEEVVAKLGLPEALASEDKLEIYDKINFLKGGIQYANAITTVSPTYAKEICQNDDFGAGLSEVLAKRSDDIHGIINGVDYGIWDPTTDPFIYAQYDAKRLNGKRQCKASLQRELGLPARPMVPVFGFIGRLVEQKGIDLISDTLDDMIDLGVQLVLLGEGEPHYEKALESWTNEFPKQVASRIAFDEELAHRVIAGCDCILLPSRYEPCGLVQLQALRYGSIPIARRTGGLADSIEQVEGTDGTGFLFERYHGDDLYDAMVHALDTYDHARTWRAIQLNAMQQKFSWRQSAKEYRELYRSLTGSGTESDDASKGRRATTPRRAVTRATTPRRATTLETARPTGTDE